MPQHKVEKTRFAVLGCGNIAKNHFKGIDDTEEAELVAICDVDGVKLKPYAEQYDVPVYKDYREMLKQENIDVVNICTPSGMHPSQTMLAAEAGKHVLVEKPMAIHLKDIDLMIEACRQNGVLLATVFPRRMAPAAQFAKQLIEDGRLGQLSLCSAYIKFYRTQEYYDSAGWRGTWAMDGGGVLMNQGIHTVDLLQWLVGPVQSLHGQARTVLRNIEVEDAAIASLTFKSGAMGVIEGTTTAFNQPTHRIIIHGDKGTLILTEDEITTLDIVGEEIEIPEFPPFRVIPDGHRIQIRDMALAVRDGRQPIVTGDDGRHSLEIILGTYQSSKTGAKIVLS